MAMQVTNPKKAEHMRAFNPDRDMIWAMPRLMRRVFTLMGEDGWSTETLAELMASRGITFAGASLDKPNEVIKGIAKIFNLMQQYPTHVEAHKKEYERLKALCPEFHALMGSLFMDVIFAELPMWFDQVRPKSRLAPVPDAEEIEQAANEFLGTDGMAGA